MHRINFILDDERNHLLNQLEKLEHTTKTDLLKEGIDLLVKLRSLHKTNEIDTFFGAWGNKKIDGLKFQQAIRDEWDN